MISDNFKICFVMLQFKYGGCERIFINIAKALKIQLYLVLLTDNIDIELFKQIPPNVKVIFKGKRNIINNPINTIIGILYARYAIRDFFGKDEYVVINFNDTLSTLLTCYLSSSGCLMSWIHCRPEALKLSRIFPLYSYLLSKCDKIITICNEQKHELLKTIPSIIKNRVVVIYNPIDFGDIHIKSNEEIEYVSDKRKILMVGRLDTRSKDYYTLIDAFRKAHFKIKDIQLLIIGDGSDKEKIMKYSEPDKDLRDIIFLGPQNNPYKWMSSSDLFILSSKSEGLPTVILEALACGSFVISSDCQTGPKEILMSEHPCGMIFPIGDSNDLADKIAQFFNNEIDVSYFKKNVIQRLRDFSFETFVQKFNDLIYEGN